MSLICSFDETKNRRKFNRRKDCIEKFCNDLKQLVTETINHKEKEMISLEDEETTIYESQKVCHICKEKFCYDEINEKEFKLYQKVRDHCHYTGLRGADHSICNLRYKISKKIPIAFQNGSTYHYYFIIKQLAEDFKGQFKCLGENTET